MKFQFFLKNFLDIKDIDNVHKHLQDKKLEEVACTTAIISDVVEEIDRNKIIAVIDYPYGNSSCFARLADIEYCLELGIKNIEMPINAEFILSSNLDCITDEFNDAYEKCAKKKCILKPMIDYRLLSNFDKNDNTDYISVFIMFLKKKIAIDCVTINSGQICDYFNENYEMCRNMTMNNIKPTTILGFHDKKRIKVMSEYAYRIRLTNQRSLRLL